MIRLKSFDIFDTLIARRCIDPHDIFRAIEIKSGFENFCQLRIEAERQISNGEYNLDDIYSKFQFDTGIDEVKMLELKNLELQEEFDNVIPIQENISKVSEGDLLISDMYLPRHIIGQLVSIAGCKREVPIIVSSHGKSQGYIWPILKQHVEIDLHTGDNINADIQSPRAHAIRCRHTDVSNLNNVEAFLKSAGLLQLCKAIRELRLSQHDENPLLQVWTQAQCKYNIPLLALSVFHIFNECIALDRETVLLSSRDCYFLKRIFDGFNFDHPTLKSSYFFTSRLARLSTSDDYSQYVRSSLSGKPLIVDLCGTGWSISAMLERADVSVPFCLLHDISDHAVTTEYMNIRSVNKIHQRSFLLKDSGINNTFIEQLNFVDHGMTVDVKYLTELKQFLPVQKSTNYPAEIRMYIKMTESIVDKFCQILKYYDIKKMCSEAHNLGVQFPEVFKAIYSVAAVDTKISPIFGRYCADENEEIMFQLKNELA